MCVCVCGMLGVFIRLEYVTDGLVVLVQLFTAFLHLLLTHIIECAIDQHPNSNALQFCPPPVQLSASYSHLPLAFSAPSLHNSATFLVAMVELSCTCRCTVPLNITPTSPASPHAPPSQSQPHSRTAMPHRARARTVDITPRPGQTHSPTKKLTCTNTNKHRAHFTMVTRPPPSPHQPPLPLPPPPPPPFPIPFQSTCSHFLTPSPAPPPSPPPAPHSLLQRIVHRPNDTPRRAEYYVVVWE